MTSSTPETLNLKATYISPSNAPFAFTVPITAPTTSSPRDRVAYLSALKKATAELQENINKELTDRMEEDKAKEATSKGKGIETNGVDEKKEEDNYGEEVVEED